jgi:hypothetical protein
MKSTFSINCAEITPYSYTIQINVDTDLIQNSKWILDLNVRHETKFLGHNKGENLDDLLFGNEFYIEQ